jgi:epoxyqueuosine reductase
LVTGIAAERLKSLVREKAYQLGFTLVGIALPQAPAHMDVYQDWLAAGRQAGMNYLADPRAVQRRADPLLILPECRSILVLGTHYSKPVDCFAPSEGRVAAYALGADYHLALPGRLQALVRFLEEQTGQSIPNRWYTDTGPILERELGMRAGLGWIGKNTCLINPRSGSTFFLAEILLGIELPPDEPFLSDQCGSCTRCIDACPTGCILPAPDRTLNARRCISYLTIENKAEIPEDLRPLLGNWVFGCDICQMVCPWNQRFAPINGDAEFAPRAGAQSLVLADELMLTAQEFNQKFKDSPFKRAKRRGYLRNVAVAAGNSGRSELLLALVHAIEDSEPLVRDHARWAIEQIQQNHRDTKPPG